MHDLQEHIPCRNPVKLGQCEVARKADMSDVLETMSAIYVSAQRLCYAKTIGLVERMIWTWRCGLTGLGQHIR
jgi:hypothetical protein